MFYRYNCNISKTLHELGNYCNYLTLLHFHVTIKYQKAQKNLKDIVSLRFEKVAASYSPALHCSTIGAGGLNFSVRNGKRWDPAAITT